MKKDPILNELDGLSPELARFKRASREAQAAEQSAEQAGGSKAGDEPVAQASPAEAERMAKLRAGILARTVGQKGEKLALPHDPSKRPAKTRTLFPRVLAAAAVLAAVMIGAWFALRPSEQPCETILCALDELSDAELAALVGTTITWSSNSDWGLDETEELAGAALEAGWLDDWTEAESADADAWIDEALSGDELNLDDWTWGNASLDDLAAMGEDLSDAEWDALLLEAQSPPTSASMPDSAPSSVPSPTQP